MTPLLIVGRVEHVCPYTDLADRPTLVWDITLSTAEGTVTLAFGTPRLLEISPGDAVGVTVEEGDIEACAPDLEGSSKE